MLSSKQYACVTCLFAYADCDPSTIVIWHTVYNQSHINPIDDALVHLKQNSDIYTESITMCSKPKLSASKAPDSTLRTLFLPRVNYLSMLFIFELSRAAGQLKDK